jgi:hypothetical protein
MGGLIFRNAADTQQKPVLSTPAAKDAAYRPFAIN